MSLAIFTALETKKDSAIARTTKMIARTTPELAQKQ
jgi:hypothetical protein